MAQPGRLPKKTRGYGARRKTLPDQPGREELKFGDAPRRADRTPGDAPFLGQDIDRTPTSSTPVYDALPTPLRVPSKKLDTKSSGRGDGGAEQLFLIRKELREKGLIDKDNNFINRKVGKKLGKAKGGSVRAFNNGGAVMSGRGPKFKGIT
jgi:hypothetical protein